MWVSGNFFDLSFAAKALFTFVAGLVTFLAPCTLPMIPGYIAYIAGFSKDRSVVLKKSVLFVVGFSFVFMLFGTLAGLIGEILGNIRPMLSFLGGVVVAGFGALTLAGFSFPQIRIFSRFRLASARTVSAPWGAFILGASLGFGWIPCIGLILGSVLTLAASSTHAIEGALLLGIFCAGLGIPFLLVALGIERADAVIRRYPLVSKMGSIAGGVVLVGMGLLLVTHSFGYFSSWLFRVFSFLNYDALLKYL